MDRVFNMGIGFVMIVSQYYAESIQRQLARGPRAGLRDRRGARGRAGRGVE